MEIEKFLTLQFFSEDNCFYPGSIFFFNITNHTTRYKAKVIDLNKETGIVSVYIFNTNETIFIRTTVPTEKKAPSLTDEDKIEQTQSSLERIAPSTIKSPISGRIIKIHVSQNRSDQGYIKKGAPLVTIESMKMENEIAAPFDLFIKSIPISEGFLVKKDEVLFNIEKKNK